MDLSSFYVRGCLLVCVSALDGHAEPMEAKRGHWILGTGVPAHELWVLKTEFRSATVASALSCCAVLAPRFVFYLHITKFLSTRAKI